MKMLRFASKAVEEDMSRSCANLDLALKLS